MKPWNYQLKPFTLVELLSEREKPEGFIYIIRNHTTQKIYIGRKSFSSKRKISIGKLATAKMIDKRGSKTKTVVKPSNWESYTGSNKLLNEDIGNGSMITREILKLCYTKKQMTYWELFYQFDFNVLEKGSYNDNILGKFFRSDLLHNPFNGEAA